MAEPLTLSASLVSAGDQFGQIARRFDLAVAGQAEPETNPVNENIIEAALMAFTRRRTTPGCAN
jgi:hypothetical protein